MARVKKFKSGEPGFCLIDLASLIKASWNYKQDDEAKAAKLRANMERNGQIESVIVRELPDGKIEVVNGNHRLAAMQGLKIDPVMCFNLGVVSDKAAHRIAIETNETRFNSDALMLAELIRGLGEEFDLSDLSSTLPFTEDEIKGMSELLDFDWNQFAPPDDGDDGDDRFRLVIDFESEADRDEARNDLDSKWGGRIKVKTS